MQNAFIGALYIVITTICIGVSLFSSYVGFYSMLGLLALPVALIIGCGLAASDAGILNYRRQGKSIAPVVLFLLIVMVPSFVSNLNYIYPRITGGTLLNDRLETASSVFDQNMRDAEAALYQRLPPQDTERRVTQQLRALRDEVTDEQNPGFGSKARQHLNAVYAGLDDLDQAIAKPELPPTSAPMETAEVTLANIEARTLEALRRSAASEPFGAILIDIEEARQQKERRFAELDGSAAGFRAAINDPRLEAIKGWAETTNRIFSLTDQAHADAGLAFTLTPATVETQSLSLSRIPDTLYVVFVDRPNAADALTAATLALLIDLVPLIFALVFIHPPAGKRLTRRPAVSPASFAGMAPEGAPGAVPGALPGRRAERRKLDLAGRDDAA